jgi:hypothetical protein
LECGVAAPLCESFNLQLMSPSGFNLFTDITKSILIKLRVLHDAKIWTNTLVWNLAIGIYFEL